MKKLIIFGKILILGFLFNNLAPLEAYPSCPIGDPKSTDYILRDNNRCEGLRDNFVISGSDLELISFTTSNIEQLDKTLTLKVPCVKDTKPGVFVQTTKDGYLLNEFELSKENQSPDSFLSWSFSWSSYVLEEADIPLDKLRALAAIQDYQIVHVPVILGKPSGKYEFVIFAPSATRILAFEISFNGRVVHREPRNSRQRGEIIFTWDGRNEPAGRYKLYFVGEVEQFNGPSEEIPVEITFEHNPDWLQ